MSARKYRCSVCGYEFDAYNAAKYYCLDTPLQFEDVPSDWKCPVCGYTKEVFAEDDGNAGNFVPLHLKKQIKEQNESKRASAVAEKKIDDGVFLMKEQALNHLQKIILPYWSKLADYERGGFYGYVGYNLDLKKNAPKGVILHSRILWFYSTVFSVLGGEENLKLADHAYEFLTKYCFDRKNGGLFWMMNADGSCCDSTKNAYNQAFGIYALAAYAKATGKTEALRHAYELFECIEAYCTDRYGYLEAFGADWKRPVESAICDQGVAADKTMNTLLHVLEAYTELLDADSHPRVAEKLKNILIIFKDKVFYEDFERLEVFFDAKMQPLGDIHSYGHDIEASWLLDRACNVLERNISLFDSSEQQNLKILISDTRSYTSIIAKKILECAFVNDSLCNESRGERAGQTKTDKTRIWWVQAEAVLGFYNEYEKHGSSPFLDASKRVLNYIEKNVVDKRPGSEWFACLNEDGTPVKDRPITEPWKCPYHNGRMCLELIMRNAK
ncbi:MAG: AGE family epimerase/isomerase [Treponemataceae bacterium]|nr:AGE family epimerase/isomerase [Treponemataceae bacterium]